ncbi:MAG: HD domain-containing protein [Candidatus Omnitrophica bacterium]|nr:HD domain-containing protein [Candidatus Omnitrophota bacterium]
MIKFSKIIKKERALRREPSPEKLKKEEKFTIPIREKKLPSLTKERESYPELLNFSRRIWSKIEKKEKINLEDLEDRTAKIVDSFSSSNLLSEYWENIIKDYPVARAYFPNHSLNVCLLSLAMGMELKYPTAQLVDLGIASLLHEAGMSALPEKILFKNGKLTPGERTHINLHPLHGRDRLKEIEGINKDILLAVHQEHERGDGRGYPGGYKDEQIHEWAKIIGLADTFEALTHSRAFRRRVPPEEAILRIIETGSERQFARSILKVLLRQITFYPMDTWLRLSTGEIGRVCRTIPDSPLKPEVEIYFDSQGRKLETPKRINLCQDSLYSIRRTLTDKEIGRIYEKSETL